MAKLGVIKVAGQSGQQYTFRAYSLGTAFRKGVGAVFVVTRRRQVQASGIFKHRRIGLDQTDDLRLLLSGEAKSLAAHGVNCICVHGEKDRAARLGIQQDLARRPGPAAQAS